MNWDNIIEQCNELKHTAVADQDFMLAAFWRDTRKYFIGWHLEIMLEAI